MRHEGGGMEQPSLMKGKSSAAYVPILHEVTRVLGL